MAKSDLLSAPRRTHWGLRTQRNRQNNVGALTGGLAKPTSGDILVDDQPLPMHQYCPVQLVPQHPELTFNPGVALAMRFMMPGDLMLNCLPVFTSILSG